MPDDARTPVLNLTRQQIEVIGKVLGVNCMAGLFTAAGAALGASLGGGQPAVMLRYGIMPTGRSPANIHALYGCPSPTVSGNVRITFTDKQRQEMNCQGIKPCDFVDVGILPMYGLSSTPQPPAEPVIIQKYGVPLAPNVKPSGWETPTIMLKYGLYFPTGK